jgi:hypothetical protein
MLFKFTIIFFVFNSLLLIGQPRLEITPDVIEFEDIFHRNKNVYFINTGDAPLRIDSLVYKRYNYYFIRFNRPWEYPVILQPNDSVKMDCILESYVYVQSADTSDTLLVYNNGERPIEKLKIKIKYYDDDYGRGYISGIVTNGTSPIDNAKIYFFYNNNYIISSTRTNQSGYYYAPLPPGQYAIAVEKDSYYVSFYQNQYDPFNADLVTLQRDSTLTLDLQLDGMIFTGNSVSGIVSDSLSFARIKKGILVVRTGTHTPGKNSVGSNRGILQNGIYTAFIKADGSYNIQNVIIPGYYYVQAFSDYYVPSFYTYANRPAIFWQQADSVLISGALSNVNVVMNRDSSVGGGIINGQVTVNPELSNLTDVLIYAKSIDNNLWYNYGFLKDINKFKLANLPYGNYKLFAQKIGYSDGTSTDLQITPTNTVINGVNIPILISSIEYENHTPTVFQLEQNYPNPFNPTTKIRYAIPLLRAEERGWSTILKVYDILGNEVATLVNEEKPSGYYEINFNASGLASGMYFYKLQAENYSETKKMILLR